MDEKKNQNQKAEEKLEMTLDDMETVTGGAGDTLKDKTAKTKTHDITKDTEENV
jgi:hypothetical protein